MVVRMMEANVSLIFLLILFIHCVLLSGLNPGPGPGTGSYKLRNDVLQSWVSPFIGKESAQSRNVDKRVKFTVLEGQDAGTYVGTIPVKPGFVYRFNEAPNEFILNGTSGDIRTNKILDREALASDRFDLVILSSQPTYPIEVSVVIVDINDNSPSFPEPSIQVSFSENANTGTRVILDTATDGDAGENDITTDYKIVSGNEDKKFRLIVTTNPSGETPYLHLETTEKLDRETTEKYQLNISAEDGGEPRHYGFLLVNVSILDVNDNSPTFDHSDYIVSLSESVSLGTSVLQVKATDIDLGENSRLSYYLSETETQFSVDPETGIISVIERLNCPRNCPRQEQCQKSCVFTVFARDHGSPRQDGRTYVTVNLQDANDHDPVVSFRYFSATAEYATVDENAQNGSVVAVVSVIDADERLNGEATAEIRGGNELHHFTLDSKDSFDIVRVSGTLDREKISKYNVTIVATDKGVPPRSSTAFLIIHVNDINDHEPVFEKSEYSAILTELVPVGTYVVGITANDEDTGVNSNIYYDITSGNDNQWFTIDRLSGLITTKAYLDREIKDSFDLKISARDGGPNPKRAYTFLKITILDENDETPTFSDEIINVTLSENAKANSVISILSAVDHDRGTNGSISYVFHEEVEHKYPGKFALDSSTGNVSTKVDLDREEIASYKIKVIANDQGIPSLSSTATINLEVQDVNDNNPEFYPIHYLVILREDLPLGSTVATVTATDKDEGPNSIITYWLKSENDNDNTFEINPSTGIIILSGRLSGIRKARYHLSVAASDKGDRRASQNATIDVIIQNNNVRPLQFQEKIGYEFKITENYGIAEGRIGNEVGKVAVRHEDIVDGLKYSILSGDPDRLFVVDKYTGVLKALKSVDREKNAMFYLEVAALTSLSYGRTYVNITVHDVNDNHPVFSVPKAFASVAENWPVGHQVYLARAYDSDDGLNSLITYKLTKNPYNLFHISPKSGMIYLKTSVKYGELNELTLEVTASDSGNPVHSSKLLLTVTVEDVNDHTPIFEHESYETSLLESTPVNDRFFALTASDKDVGKNGFVSYDITEGNDDGKFGIFPDGYLYVRSELDREARDYFSLTIVARDHGLPSRSSTVSVIIHILDENDNPPKFKNNTFQFYLDENEPPDTYVGRITASDLDKGRNTELTYSIDISQNNFVVDPKSGFIKTLHYFDRERLIQTTGNNFIMMDGIVKDNGVNRLSDKAQIIIYISDVNDNPPVFTRKSYRASVSEGIPTNTQVIRFGATDVDDGPNGEIHYAIVSGNEKGYFKLDEHTGQIFTTHPLDREMISVFHLGIVALDAGLPEALSATTDLTIDVLDENDNEPVFVSKDFEIMISENTEINTVLYKFEAFDADLRLNKDISYGIIGGNIADTFHIDVKTGILYLNRLLDFEQRETYQLNVTATDSGSPPLTSSVSLIIKVLDYNDNPPTFPNTAIVRQIEEGIAPKTSIVTVIAFDPDSGNNGRIKYAMRQEDPPGNHFMIQEDTGVIMTVKDIDREFTDTFLLTVVATDQSDSLKLSAEKQVTVIVEDINDNAPQFVSLNAAILPKDAPVGYTIMKILAMDADANSNGQVIYELISNVGSYFGLERDGSLKVKQPITVPSIMYELKVRASDEAVQQHIQYSDESLTILTYDPSEEGPQFSRKMYSGTVIEGVGIGSSVVNVSARMTSSPARDIVFYVINITSDDGNSANRVFDMQHNTLVTAAELDREAGPEQYIVTVAAVAIQGSGSRLATAQVHVTILDKNDSPPVFAMETSRFSVSEDILAGRSIATVTATDPDTLGDLSYSIVDGDDYKFSINASTGLLTPTNTLDREIKSSYQLTVRADDGNQHTDTTVFVEVTDTNDNPPVFDQPAYSFDIFEDSERGSQVGTVHADDYDEGTNGYVSYAVISDWGNDVFSLNPQTGVFTLTSRLDYEQVQHYIFVVQAQDTGIPPLSSTVEVYFNVKDLNDNAPIFDPMSYSDEIVENVTVGSSVLAVSATDQDSGLNGKISYSIAGGDDKHHFSISSNGTIITENLLDREELSFYNLVVMATDMAEVPLQRLSSSVQVAIVLKDVNDMAPEFVTPNETTVAENTPINTVIMAIKAIDRDEGRNSYIDYSMEPLPKNTFTLGPGDGLLRVTGHIDREEIGNYTLVVTAKDRGTPSNARTMTISLRVSDENDNSPIFDPKQYSASVSENASIGLSILQVSATDADEGFNGRVRYSIVAGDKNRDFSISEDTGVIRVAKNLNYERRNHYLLTIQAEDSGTEVRYDSATVTISIMDINDNAPIFLDSPYLIYVMENMEGLPTSIATVTAFDADNSPYNTVNYLIKEGDKSLFSINASSGEISLLRALDREIQDHLTLTVVAMDSGTPRLTGTGTISVLVEDENDHEPVFSVHDYSVSVSEGIQPRTSVLTLTASDLDTEENSDIRYFLVGGSAETFSVDAADGILRTKKLLDRETRDHYTLEVEARDSSLTRQKSASAKVFVTVTDENDNPPVFQSKRLDIYIPSPTLAGDFVFGGAAYDPDEGENGKIIYHMSGQDAAKFDLDQWKGIIKASVELTSDRAYHIIVGAQDFGSPPLSSTIDLNIRLQPRSLFPVFDNVDNMFSFSENSKGALITQVVARAPNSKHSENIKYRIAGGNVGRAFEIDDNSGKLYITQNGVDYETLHQYELFVSAVDVDHPLLASTLSLIVNVSDYNDNAPVFAESIYNISLMEDLYPPQLVTTVHATDKDVGSNAELFYQLRNAESAKSMFSLDSETGNIYTKLKLKRDEIDKVEFVVEAVDKGFPAQTGSAMILIHIQDKNNNPPRFTRLFSVNVTENADIGTFVIQVTSSDKDIGENANVTYSFTENPENKFKIDPMSGNVTVAGLIDRELRDEFALKVSASDGSWKAETPLTIIVQDENDNAPIFDKDFYEFNLPELQRAVVFVGQVKALDKDKHGPNSAISFSLKFPSDFFSVDSASGEILSKQTLKYKHTLKGSSPENQYHLMVVAIDNGKPPMSSETSVLINVVNENNSQPRFKKQKYFFALPENAVENQRLISVQAMDDTDYGINSQIIYDVIEGNGTEYFNLESGTGWLKLSKNVLGKIGWYFSLMIQATDRGVPPLHDEVFVTVAITGENKYAPKFTASSYQVIIAENEKLGSTIGTVRASDEDEGANGMVTYAIESGNEAQKFAIDESTGSVTILSTLDYDSVQEYRLNITARDLAFHSKYATAILSVLLTDVNDNPPIFNQSEYKAYIPENFEIGTSIFRLHAEDIDSAENAIISYVSLDGEDKSSFTVNSKTGLVQSRKVFDYEGKIKYTLNIVAANPESEQKAFAKLHIFVTGQNEFYPKFNQPLFQFTVSESAGIGTSVGTVRATDQDQGTDGTVYYLLVGASNDRGFSIHPSTGVLTVARDLDRESQNRVVLTVMAKNFGSIKGNDTDEAQIVVSILDGNDPPVFSKSFYKMHISEGVIIGTKVLTVSAVDTDVKPQNNQFIYSIIGGNVGQVFKVDPQTGVIETTAQLDRETTDIYNLTIGAIDAGNPPQTGTTLVQVILEDVNDNGPQFDPPNLVGYVAENEPAITSVLTLSAMDPDLPPNTKPFSYYIVGGEHRDFFTINENSGEVKTTRSIDRETTPSLNFQIEVHDSGKPKMKSHFPVSVIVLDKNDSPATPRSVTVKVRTYLGNFRGGKIADVHPNDADTSGQYTCQIVNPQSSMFSIPNGCNLHVVPGFYDHSYSLSILGNDGRFPSVTSDVEVQFESFHNASLDNSIVVRLLNVTADRFLRLYYNSFVESLSRLFSNQFVHIYSVTSSDDHTDLVIAAESLRSDDFMRSKELSSKLKDNEATLTHAFQGISYVVNYNPCDGNPCANSGICYNAINAYAEMEINDSPALILTSPIIRNDIKCNCSQFFTGSRCELPQDPCSPNPCQFGGICSRKSSSFICTCPPTRQGPQCEVDKVNACDNSPCVNGGSCQTTLEGGFFCLCRPGFRGNQCELESESCRPNPCQNGGSCLSLRPGYKCSCPINFYGSICERSTFGFDELSFMTFPTLDSITNDISIVFSTIKPNSLLVYNYGLQTGGRSDFIAIELNSGNPRFSYGGARTEISHVSLDRQVADGKWYKITATRNGQVISLSVATCSDSGEICDDCQPTDNCYADDVGLTGTLNFNNEPMYLGGVMTVDPIQERPNQVFSDDFIGCIQRVSINGRPLNLSGSIQKRGISNVCKRVANVCSGNPCGEKANCMDKWSAYSCKCPNGLFAPNCDMAFQPVTYDGESYIEFMITERHRRKQLLPRFYQNHSPWSSEIHEENIKMKRHISSVPPKSLSLNFRTVKSDGIILHAATNNDYTLIEIQSGLLVYTSKLGANKPLNMTLIESVHDGAWHNLTLLLKDQLLKIIVDQRAVGYELQMSSIHDFLDAYLTSFTLGDAPFSSSYSAESKGFYGCMESLTIDGELQPFNSTGSTYLEAISHGALFVSDCATFIGFMGAADPLSIGVTLVIVFFVLLLVAIFISFVVYRFRRQKKEKDGGHIFQNGSALLANTSSDSGRTPQDSGYVETTEMTEEVLRAHLSQELIAKKYKDRDHDRPQRPDIIEREVINKSPGIHLRVAENPHSEMAGLGHIQDSEQPEHYDLENASSIAPSDIDIVYHYKGYRDGNVRKYKTNPHVPGYHKHNHRHSPHNFPTTPHRDSPRNLLRQSPNPVAHRESPSMLKMQSTPLARLSPSSELSQQTPRILTLQDLSGKPLQTALLATSQGPGVKDVMTNSERSLNSPVSHLSHSSGSVHASSRSVKKIKHDNSVSLGLTAKEIERINSRSRNTSLLTTLDAVSSSSEDHQRKEKLTELLEKNTQLMETADSSTDESGNDSFTCSEFEYDNNYEKVTRDFGPGTMIFSKLAEVDNENDHDNESSKNYDGFDSFRGSLSTLVASDDDLSSYKPPNGSTFAWDNLLNWGPNYENLVGVFKDIAELPDSNSNIVSHRGTPKPSEEYV